MKKFLLYTFAYIIATIVTAFGMITINSFLPKKNTTIQLEQKEEVQDNIPKEATDGEKLLNSLLGISNTNVSLKFNVYDKTIPYSAQTQEEQFEDKKLKMVVQFDGSFSIMDLENIKICGTLTAKLNDTNIVIDIAFIDKKLYLSNETMSIKLENASFAKLLELLPTLGLKMDFGVDISSLDTDTLMKSLQDIEAKKLDNGQLLMTFALSDEIYLDIYTDNEYNIMSVATNSLELENGTAILSAELEQNENIEITNPEQDKEYIDVTKTLNIVDNIREIITNKRIHLNINASLSSKTDITLIGGIDIDYNEEINAFATFDVDLNGSIHKISIGYIHDNIYLSINNLKFMIDKENIEETISIISEHFNIEQAQENLLVSIAKIIPGFELSKVLEGDFTDININNLLAFSKGEDNVINITLYGKAIGISNDLNIVITLDENEQFSSLNISNIQVLDGYLSANISYDSNVTIPDLSNEDYIKLLDIPRFSNAMFNTIKDLQKTKHCTINIDTQFIIKNINLDVTGLLSFDFLDSNNLKIYGDINATINNKLFKIYIGIINEDVYLIIDNLKFKTSTENIGRLIEKIKDIQSADYNQTIFNTLFSITQTPNLFTELLKGNIDKLPQDLIVSLESTYNKLSTTINKTLLNTENDINIIINYEDSLNGLNINNVKLRDNEIELNFNLTNELHKINFSQYEYTSIDDLDSLVYALLNTTQKIVNDKSIALEINSEIILNNNVVTLNGILAYKNQILYLDFNVLINEYTLPIVIYIENNIVYITIDSFKVSIPIKEIRTLTQLIFADENIQNVITNIANFNLERIKNIDFSCISFNAIKNIAITKNNSKLVIDKDFISAKNDLEIICRYNDNIKNIFTNTILFNNLQAQINLDIVSDFTIPAISGVFNDISSINNFANALKNTLNQLLNKKEIAFNIDACLNIGSKNVLVNGLIYIDFSKIKEQFNFTDLNVYASINIGYLSKNYELIFRLYNNYIYINYQNFKIKIACNKISDIIDEITNVFDIDLSNFDFSSYIDGSVLEDFINKNYSSIKLSIIKSLTLTNNNLSLTMSKEFISSNDDFIINIDYLSKVNSITINNLSIKDIYSNVKLQLVDNFVHDVINTDEYSDLSHIDSTIRSISNTIENIKNSKQIALELDDTQIMFNGSSMTLNGNIYLNFKNTNIFNEENKKLDLNNLNMYINLSIEDSNGYNTLSIQTDSDRLYITYNTFNICISISEIDSIIELIQQFKFISKTLKTQDITNISIQKLIDDAKASTNLEENSIDFINLIKSNISKINIDEILGCDFSNFDLNIIKEIAVENSSCNIIISKEIFNAMNDLILYINYSETINSIKINNLFLKDLNISSNILLLDNFIIPEIANYDIYVNLDSLDSAIDSVLQTAIEVVDNKHIAFDLSAQIINTKIENDKNNVPTKEVETIINLLDGSNAEFEWNNAYENNGNINEFIANKMTMHAILNVEATTNTYNYENGVKLDSSVNTITKYHVIEITLLNNIVYIKFNNLYVKISGESIDGIISSICEILGIGDSENMLDNIKSLMNTLTDKSLLNKLSLEMIKSLNLSSMQFSGQFDLTNLGLGISALNDLTLNINYSANGLDMLAINNLCINNNQINNLVISLKDFEEIINAPEGEYIDLSGINEFLVAIKNTVKLSDYEFDGSVNLKLDVIGINIDWDIPVNIKAKIIENSLESEITLGAIPVVPGVNDDVPYMAGNITSGIYSGLNRILKIYIKDDMIYLYRSEDVPTAFVKNRIYEKKLKIHFNTLEDDPLYYLLQYGMGFSDSIMDAIYKAFYKERINPIDYSNVLKGFSSNIPIYILTLNLRELTENDQLDTMSLGIKTINYNNESIIGNIIFNMFMPVANNVEITLSTDNLEHKNIGQILNFDDMYRYVNDYIYKEGAQWDAYNSDWQLSSQRKFTLNFVTNCETNIDNITEVAGSSISLPTLDSYFVDNLENRIIYTFDGWYTTQTFENGSKYVDDIMPRKDTTLYAKWNTEIIKYITISFVTNGGAPIADIIQLENSKLILPNYLDTLLIETEEKIEEKQFDGWFIDSDLTQKFESETMPSINLVLYAKWSIVNSAEAHTLSIYDMGEKILTRRIIAGKNIELSGAKFNTTTKYYIDSDLKTEIDIKTFIMPTYNIDLYIKNAYSIKIISQYGNVINVTFINKYQGDSISIIEQNSYEIDNSENELNKTHRTFYTFNGYYANNKLISDINNYTMPNEDVEIIANWVVTVKKYVTITFNVTWVKPGMWQDNNSKWFGKIECLSAPQAPQSIKILQDTTFNPSLYNATCKYRYTGGGVSKTYTFEIKSWNLQSPQQLYYNGAALQNDSYDNILTNLSVVEDAILYAVWYNV